MKGRCDVLSLLQFNARLVAFCCGGTKGQISSWIGWNRLETKRSRCGPDCHLMDIVRGDCSPSHKDL